MNVFKCIIKHKRGYLRGFTIGGVLPIIALYILIGFLSFVTWENFFDKPIDRHLLLVRICLIFGVIGGLIDKHIDWE